ncbi:hypothetical protein J6590_041101 [Homalodisca vitripennis]|nr:hypothetical protein J6590_041101 [Homalodisca vitripennis]
MSAIIMESYGLRATESSDTDASSSKLADCVGGSLNVALSAKQLITSTGIVDRQTLILHDHVVKVHIPKDSGTRRRCRLYSLKSRRGEQR